MVALSDYGRDRIAYQAYDTLFSPELPPELPMGNRSVLKMQGAQALLDWLALNSQRADVASGPAGHPPGAEGGPDPEGTGAGTIAGLLQDTLQQPELQDELARHLNGPALSRPMRFRPFSGSTPVPARCRWFRPPCAAPQPVAAGLGRPRGPAGDLLPEFITRALFEPLNVPEVWFDLPFSTDQDESLPIERALREAVPGRVSRRYGYQRQSHRPGSRCHRRRRGTSSTSSLTPRYTRREPGPRPARGRLIRDRCR